MQIESQKSLKPFNTFGVDVRAAFYAEVRSAEDFRELLADMRFAGAPKLVLGGGSNILFTKDFEGLVIKNAIAGIERAGSTETQVTVRAGAGVGWHDLVMWCVERGYAGLENLSLIPGLAGAAPVQNIGAYGAELKEVFNELEAVDLSFGETVRFGTVDCAFGYRDSVFKNKFRGRYLIVSVSLCLTDLAASGAAYVYRTGYAGLREALKKMKVREPSLQAVSEAVCQVRRAKLPDPAVLGNAGSFFKNPSVPEERFQALASEYPAMPHFPQEDGAVKIPAGWLIEQCGWKGRRAGRAGVHKDQALVLVNYGGATGREILDLAHAVRDSVRERFEIELSPEVEVI